MAPGAVVSWLLGNAMFAWGVRWAQSTIAKGQVTFILRSRSHRSARRGNGSSVKYQFLLAQQQGSEHDQPYHIEKMPIHGEVVNGAVILMVVVATIGPVAYDGQGHDTPEYM